jgi:endonuclease YncB( thermonuclease family)
MRLAGIDAPEKQQDFGPQAKQQLTELCLDKRVQVEVRTIDRFGRTVARASCDEVDVAPVMLERGMAWHFSRYASTQPLQEAESDRLAQERAKDARIGLWGLPEPMAPWDWRARHNHNHGRLYP